MGSERGGGGVDADRARRDDEDRCVAGRRQRRERQDGRYELGLEHPAVGQDDDQSGDHDDPGDRQGGEDRGGRCGRGRPGDQHDQQGERDGHGLPQDPLPHH